MRDRGGRVCPIDAARGGSGDGTGWPGGRKREGKVNKSLVYTGDCCVGEITKIDRQLKKQEKKRNMAKLDDWVRMRISMPFLSSSPPRARPVTQDPSGPDPIRAGTSPPAEE